MVDLWKKAAGRLKKKDTTLLVGFIFLLLILETPAKSSGRSLQEAILSKLLSQDILTFAESGRSLFRYPGFDRPVVAVDAPALWREFDSNSVSATASFKGKTFSVTGTVLRVQIDLDGQPYMEFVSAADGFSNVVAYYVAEMKEELASYRPGQRVTLVCQGVEKGFVVRVSDCRDTAKTAVLADEIGYVLADRAVVGKLPPPFVELNADAPARLQLILAALNRLPADSACENGWETLTSACKEDIKKVLLHK